jgi:drug/metabolite transporter (DMT)-like permease
MSPRLRRPVAHARAAWPFASQFAAFFVCGGVALVARASSSPHESDGIGLGAGLIGTVCALVASVSDAAFLVATRAIGRRQDAVTLTMWMGFAIVLVMAPLCLAAGVAMVPARAADVASTVSTLLCGGVISLLSNVFLNMGLERLEAAPANVLAALQVPAAYFLQVALFAEPASPAAALGAGIIVTCALAVTLAQADASASPSGGVQVGGGCCVDAGSDSVEAQPLLAGSAWPAGPKKSSD